MAKSKSIRQKMMDIVFPDGLRAAEERTRPWRQVEVTMGASSPFPPDVEREGVVLRGFPVKPKAKPLYKYMWGQMDWNNVHKYRMYRLFAYGPIARPMFYVRGVGAIAISADNAADYDVDL